MNLKDDVGPNGAMLVLGLTLIDRVVAGIIGALLHFEDGQCATLDLVLILAVILVDFCNSSQKPHRLIPFL